MSRVSKYVPKGSNHSRVFTNVSEIIIIFKIQTHVEKYSHHSNERRILGDKGVQHVVQRIIWHLNCTLILNQE